MPRRAQPVIVMDCLVTHAHYISGCFKVSRAYQYRADNEMDLRATRSMHFAEIAWRRLQPYRFPVTP